MYCVLADGWFSLTTRPAEMLSFYPGVNTYSTETPLLAESRRENTSFCTGK